MGDCYMLDKMWTIAKNTLQFRICILLSWIILSFNVIMGYAINCYDCRSTNNPDCGPRFKYSNFDPKTCPEEYTLCGLQRQKVITGSQISAIVRICYRKGEIRGLSDSIGCRMWSNKDNYTAEYCFCDTDLCNSASATNLDIHRLMAMCSLAVFVFCVVKVLK